MKYKIGTQTEIHAPLDKVWEVLVDFPSYEKWNPVTPFLKLLRRPGNRFSVRRKVALGGLGFSMSSRLLVFDAPYELTWGTNLGLIRYERRQLLRWINETTTQHQTMVAFSGPLAPILMRRIRKRLKREHEMQGKKLKHYLENKLMPAEVDESQSKVINIRPREMA
ncbi:MAG: SRPBCC domain-containing protein [Bacteroidota bacterium]